MSNPALTVPVAQRTAPIIAVLLLAGMAYALSQTMVFPALPSIAEHYDAGPAAASWVLTAFFLSASVATPIVGKLGDLYGKDRVLPVVLALLCARLDHVRARADRSAGSSPAGRSQGVAGGIFPLAFGIIRDTVPAGARRRRHRPDERRVRRRRRHRAADVGRHRRARRRAVAVLESGSHRVPARSSAPSRFVPPSPRIPGAKIDWLGAAVLSLGLVRAAARRDARRNSWGWSSPKTLGTARSRGLAVLGIWLQRRAASSPSRSSTCALLRLRAVAGDERRRPSSSASRCSPRSRSSRGSCRRRRARATASATR